MSPISTQPQEVQDQDMTGAAENTVEETYWPNIERYINHPNPVEADLPKPVVNCAICSRELIVPGLQGDVEDQDAEKYDSQDDSNAPEEMRLLDRCQHVLGNSCFVRCLQVAAEQFKSPRCPFCRVKVFSQSMSPVRAETIRARRPTTGQMRPAASQSRTAPRHRLSRPRITISRTPRPPPIPRLPVNRRADVEEEMVDDDDVLQTRSPNRPPPNTPADDSTSSIRYSLRPTQADDTRRIIGYSLRPR
ncbi:hypothetical protein B0H66DRAFT_530080 [Apodospora peruviana]|uniref:RING-type domain-containing protein n=1 Tax=Apodospora peruviana TaxID=516989 RepID=A0AAE0MBG6_9PEZI|nr:hypothetical protein B0H66DRAFT_530080 [Apodospora peruviana]